MATNKLDTYSQLLDAHQKLHPDRTLKPPKRKPGRPRGQYAVKSYTISIAEDDINALKRVTNQLSIGCNKKISRGAVIGWLVRWLEVESRANDINLENVSSFSELANLIYSERD